MTTDATALTAPVNGHLDYLSQLAQQLGVRDPVESYLVPMLGRWSDLHDEAGRWRSAAQVASSVTARLTSPLAGLDAAWQGADADSFLEYMHNVGLAGHDLADALGAMADALERTANGVRQIAGELVDILVETAEQSSDAMTVPVAGATRAQQHLDEVAQPASQMYEAVRDVLDGFVKLCDGVHGGQLFGRITMIHKMPTQNWSAPAVSTPPAVTPPPASTPPASTPAGTPPATTPSPATPAAVTSQPAAASVPAHSGGVPAHAAGGGMPSGAGMPGGGGLPSGGNVAAQQTGPPAQSSAVATPSDSTPPTVPGSTPPETAGAAAGAGPAGGGGGGMPMGMGMGGMRGGGGDTEHKSKIGVSGDPREIFGKPERTAPPVIGEE